MHFVLAFHVPSDKSLDQRIEELRPLFEGETNRFDSLLPIGFKEAMSDKAWETSPYAFVDDENNWYEKDEPPFLLPVFKQKDGGVSGTKELKDWSDLWQHHCLKFTIESGRGECLIVYADCHR